MAEDIKNVYDCQSNIYRIFIQMNFNILQVLLAASVNFLEVKKTNIKNILNLIGKNYFRLHLKLNATHTCSIHRPHYL